MVKNIFTVDVEEIFHTEYGRHYKNNLPYRTPENIPIILDFLRDRNITATFFTVGEIAQRFPNTISRIKREGHEIAFQSWNHRPLWRHNCQSFKKEIKRFSEICPTSTGFRAPSFSLNNKTKWALNVLRETGYVYDSSIFPAWTPLYGISKALTRPYKPGVNDVSKEGNPNYGIIEFPLAVYSTIGLKIPMAGGFWLRFWNTNSIKKCIQQLNQKGSPAVLFIHNWEIDPLTPEIDLGHVKNFVTYHNITKSLHKIKDILSSFEFISVKDYLENINTEKIY